MVCHLRSFGTLGNYIAAAHKFDPDRFLDARLHEYLIPSRTFSSPLMQGQESA